MTRDLAAPAQAGFAAPDGRALTGQHCRLERLGAGDAPALFAAFSDPQGWDYLPYGPFADGAAFADWLNATCLGTDPLFYTVFREGTAQGMLALMRVATDHGVAEVGHVHFGPAMQGRPASTEAIYLVMRHVLGDLGYRRLEWKCNAANARSMRAAERLGFAFEGVFRQHLIVKGRNRDTAWFSMLDGEWPDRRARLERWLDPGNFDDRGQQRQRLQDMLRAG